MIVKDKVMEIFCAIDEFDKNLSEKLFRNLLLPLLWGASMRHRNHPDRLSESEIMTTFMCYHFDTLPYIQGLLPSLCQEVLEWLFSPDTVSYNRFVGLASIVFLLIMLFMILYAFGKCTGIKLCVIGRPIPRW